MVEVRWTDQALDDIDAIAEYISKDSAYYAAIQVERFLDQVRVLKLHPLAGRMVPEAGNPDIRELIQGNYRIIYRIKHVSLVHIITVHHSHMLLSNNPGFQVEGE